MQSNHNVILEFDGFPHEISRSFFVQGLGKGTVIESSRQHFEQIFPPTGSTNLLAFCTCLLNVEETDICSGLPKLLFQNRGWSMAQFSELPHILHNLKIKRKYYSIIQGF